LDQDAGAERQPPDGVAFAGQAFLQEDKAAEALPYLKRAVGADRLRGEPMHSWRTRKLRQGSTDEAIQHAERALELGHGKRKRSTVSRGSFGEARGEGPGHRGAAVLCERNILLMPGSRNNWRI